MRRVRSTAQTTQSWKASRRAVLGGAVAAGVAGTACGGGGAGGG
jgi:hypothetical protein